MKINFIEANGQEYELNINTDTTQSIMQVAIEHGVSGITGQCGGNCLCATCHCYIDEKFINKLSPLSTEENEMLNYTNSDREKNSRLSCQIKLSEALDNIKIFLPEIQ